MSSTSLKQASGPEPGHPLLGLPPEDLDLIAAFVLASGSLKELGKVYGVSYPTIRNRLDQVIERVRAAVEGRPRDPVAELLADLVQRGELAPSTARAIKAAVRASREQDRPAGAGGGPWKLEGAD